MTEKWGQFHLTELRTKLQVHDCYSLMGTGAESGPYIIRPDGTTPVTAVCDMDTEGGGWTVIQQRLDGSVDFYKYWADYVAGFGNPSACGEYWLGLDWIHLLTTLGTDTEMYIWIEAFDCESRYARFSSCSISSSSDNYRLDVSEYTGTAVATSFNNMNNHQQFSTRDRDNDDITSVDCATKYTTAGWLESCYAINPNGKYYPAPGTCPYAKGICWVDWRGYNESMKTFKIMLRQKRNS